MSKSISEYKWRRVTCRGDDFAKVILKFEKCDVGFKFVSNANSPDFPNEIILPYIEEAISEAFDLAEIDKSGYIITLENAIDVTGEASPHAFQQCTIGATLSFLGRKDLCPNPGFVD